MAAEKVTFTLPEELLRRLGKVPAGRRSLLVAEAVRRELDRRALAEALKRLRRKTHWRERRHPELRSPEDFRRYRPAKSRVTG
jgi:metal-responsive CopG/Arc/MetJ family transcriptional regulator